MHRRQALHAPACESRLQVEAPGVGDVLKKREGDVPVNGYFRKKKNIRVKKEN